MFNRLCLRKFTECGYSFLGKIKFIKNCAKLAYEVYDRLFLSKHKFSYRNEVNFYSRTKLILRFVNSGISKILLYVVFTLKSFMKG